MFGLGLWELLLIVVVVMVLFGAGKLPKVMEDLGKGVKSFKNSLAEDEKPKETPAKKIAPKKPAAKPAPKSKKTPVKKAKKTPSKK